MDSRTSSETTSPKGFSEVSSKVRLLLQEAWAEWEVAWAEAWEDFHQTSNKWLQG